MRGLSGQPNTETHVLVPKLSINFINPKGVES